MANEPGKLRRERVLEGARWDVDRVHLPRRGGGTTAREVLVHPGSVVLLPRLDDGRLVMIDNFRHSVERTVLELPAGTLEVGEDPAACAARELEEETGYRAGRLTALGAFFVAPGLSTERMHAFLAEELVPCAQSLDPTERIVARPITVEALDAMVREGRVEDAKTLAVLTLWRATIRP